MTEPIQRSLDRVARWVEDHHYKAYDPGDGQLSYLRLLAFNQPLRRVLTGAVLRSPFNIRPWLGIPPHTSTKGMGYMAWGYLKRFACDRDERDLARAKSCLDWLIEHRCPKYAQFCWGNHFPFSTRAGTIPAGEPTIVWSSLIGQAFLEAYAVFPEPKYHEILSSICDWILRLPREQTDSGACISYVAFKQSSIHNSNMLGAALLAQVGVLTGNEQALNVSREAMKYSCSRQSADGSWYYGEEPRYHWIDSFHTGYNLDSLKRYTEASKDVAFDAELCRGFEYFRANFFESDGRPKYYHDQTRPVDIQCAAQAIDTLTFFSDRFPQALAQAQKVAAWTIANMQSPDGHFYYRDLGWTKNRTAMLHWGQGTMFKALAHLLRRLQHAQKLSSSPQADQLATAKA